MRGVDSWYTTKRDMIWKIEENDKTRSAISSKKMMREEGGNGDSPFKANDSDKPSVRRLRRREISFGEVGGCVERGG